MTRKMTVRMRGRKRTRHFLIKKKEKERSKEDIVNF